MNKEYMTTKLNEYIAHSESSAYLYQLVLPVLLTWEGKQVSKRLATAVQNYVGPDYSVYVRAGYGNDMDLHIRRGNKSLEIRVCAINNKKFSMEYFKEHNVYLEKHAENFRKYTEALNHIDEWYAKYEVIKQQVIDLKKEAGVFGCEYIMDFDMRYTGE